MLALTPSESFGHPDILWHRNLPGGDSNGMEVIRTSDGGFVYTGSAYPNDRNDPDFYLCKTDSMGFREWDQTYRGFPNGRDQGDATYAIRQLPNGDFCLAGGGGGVTTGTVIRTNSEGELIWMRYLPRDEGFGTIWACEIANDGNLVVTGYSKAAKLDIERDGEIIWQHEYGGDGLERLYAMAKSPDSGFLLVGDTDSFGAGGKDMYVVRIDDDGEVIWERTFGSRVDEGCSAVCATPEGGWCLAGWNRISWNESYPIMVSIDDEGNERWRKIRNETNGALYSITLTADEGFAALGRSDSSHSFYGLRVDSQGEILWEHGYSEFENSLGYCILQMSDRSYILAGNAGAALIVRTDPDPFETPYEYEVVDTEYDFGFMPLDTAAVWNLGIANVGRRSGRVLSARFTQGGNVFACAIDTTERVFPNDTLWLPVSFRPLAESLYIGRLRLTMEGDTTFMISLVGRGSLNVATEEEALIQDFKLSSAYPNPFNSTTTIRFGLDKSAPTRLAVYDTRGRLVADLWTGRDAYSPKGEHKVVWDASGLPSGVYLVRLDSDSRHAVRKLVLMK